MMQLLKKILGISACALLPMLAQAHGYWLETEGTHKAMDAVTIKMFYGEYESGERLTGKSLDKMKDIKVFVTNLGGGKQEVNMKQENEYWIGAYTANEEGVYSITALNDVRDVQDWTKHDLGIVRPIQYLETEYTVGSGKKQGKADNYLDVEAKELKEGSYEITLTKDGKKLGEQTIIYGAFNGAGKEVKTDKKGKAVIALSKPGAYVLSIDWIDKTPGVFKDKKYESIRHRMDYTLYR